jgi:hypothetical protein
MTILRNNENMSAVRRVWDGVAVFLLSDGGRFAKSDDDNRIFASRGLITGNPSSPKQLVSAKGIFAVVIRRLVLEAAKG